MDISPDSNQNPSIPPDHQGLHNSNFPTGFNIRGQNGDLSAEVSTALAAITQHLNVNRDAHSVSPATASFRRGLERMLSKIAGNHGEPGLEAAVAICQSCCVDFRSYKEFCRLAWRVSGYLDNGLEPQRVIDIAELLKGLRPESQQDFFDCLNKFKIIASNLNSEVWSVMSANLKKALLTGNVHTTYKSILQTFQNLAGNSNVAERDLLSLIVTEAHCYGWDSVKILKLLSGQTVPITEHVESILHSLRRIPDFPDEDVPVRLCNYGQNHNRVPENFIAECIELCRSATASSKTLVSNIQTLSRVSTYGGLNEYAYQYILQRMAFIKARNQDPLKALTDFIKVTSQAQLLQSAQAAVATLLYDGSSPVQRTLARKELEENFKADQHPVAINDTATMQQTLRQTQSILRAGLDIHFGFASLQHAAKNYDRERGSLLARAGHDLAGNVQLINANDPNAYPGGGVAISELEPLTFLGSFSAATNDFAVYRQAWPWLSKAIDQVRNTQFYFMRGAIVISNSGAEFQIDLGARKEAYSLLIVNDHFHNYSDERVYLVPTLLIEAKLSGCLIDASRAGRADDRLQDVNLRDLTPEGLKAAAASYGSPILTLATPSVFCGGLCNAFPPNSDPYFTWEYGEDDYFRDLNGHMHKAFATGIYSSIMTTELRALFKKLHGVHENVYEVAAAYFANLNLFQISQATWNKGLNQLPEDFSFEEAAQNDYQSSNELPADQKREQVEENFDLSGIDLDQESYFRMLMEAEYIHASLKAKGVVDPVKYPVLHRAPTLRYAIKPDDHFQLDTFDLVLRMKDGREFVLADQSPEERRQIWLKEIMPLYFLDSNIDLRFYDRN